MADDITDSSSAAPQPQPAASPLPDSISASDFAAAIRAKSGAYSDVDDTTLAKAMIAKYPVYADMVKFDAPASPPAAPMAPPTGATPAFESANPFGAPDNTAPAPVQPPDVPRQEISPQAEALAKGQEFLGEQKSRADAYTKAQAGAAANGYGEDVDRYAKDKGIALKPLISTPAELAEENSGVEREAGIPFTDKTLPEDVSRPIVHTGDLLQSLANVTTVPLSAWLQNKSPTELLGTQEEQAEQNLKTQQVLASADQKQQSGEPLTDDEEKATQAVKFTSQIKAAGKAIKDDPTGAAKEMLFGALESAPTYLLMSWAGGEVLAAAKGLISTTEDAGRLASIAAKVNPEDVDAASNALVKPTTASTVAHEVGANTLGMPVAGEIQKSQQGGKYDAAQLAQDLVAGGLLSAGSSLFKSLMDTRPLSPTDFSDLQKAVDVAGIQDHPQIKELLPSLLEQSRNPEFTSAGGRISLSPEKKMVSEDEAENMGDPSAAGAEISGQIVNGQPHLYGSADPSTVTHEVTHFLEDVLSKRAEMNGGVWSDLKQRIDDWDEGIRAHVEATNANEPPENQIQLPPKKELFTQVLTELQHPGSEDPVIKQVGIPKSLVDDFGKLFKQYKSIGADEYLGGKITGEGYRPSAPVPEEAPPEVPQTTPPPLDPNAPPTLPPELPSRTPQGEVLLAHYKQLRSPLPPEEDKAGAAFNELPPDQKAVTPQAIVPPAVARARTTERIKAVVAHAKALEANPTADEFMPEHLQGLNEAQKASPTIKAEIEDARQKNLDMARQMRAEPAKYDVRKGGSGSTVSSFSSSERAGKFGPQDEPVQPVRSASDKFQDRMAAREGEEAAKPTETAPETKPVAAEEKPVAPEPEKEATPSPEAAPPETRTDEPVPAGLPPKELMDLVKSGEVVKEKGKQPYATTEKGARALYHTSYFEPDTGVEHEVSYDEPKGVNPSEQLGDKPIKKSSNEPDIRYQLRRPYQAPGPHPEVTAAERSDEGPKLDAPDRPRDLPDAPRRPMESHEQYNNRLANDNAEDIKAAANIAKTMRAIARGGQRSMLAWRDRLLGIADRSFQFFSKEFDRRGDEKNLAAIDDFENEREIKDPIYKTFFSASKKMLDDRVAQIREIHMGKLIPQIKEVRAAIESLNEKPKSQARLEALRTQYQKLRELRKSKSAMQFVIQNYFPHLWKDPIKAASWYQRAHGPLEGDKAFFKDRIHDTIKDGIDNDLEPISTNPSDLVLAKISQMDKFILMNKLRSEWDANGFVKDIPPTGYIPPDAARINDPSFNGKMVPQAIAYDINNYLSPSLYKYGLWKNFRAAENILVTARLGASAFHAGFTTVDTGISGMAVALQNLLQGDMDGAVKAFGKGLISPFAAPVEGAGLLGAHYGQATKVPSWVPGSAAFNKMFGEMAKDPQTAAVLNDLTEGGARAHMDPTDYNNYLSKFMREWRSSNKFFRNRFGPMAATEITSRWITHHLVPMQKMASRVMLAKNELDRIARLAQKAERNGDVNSPNLLKGADGKAVSPGDYVGISDAMHPDVLRQIMGRINRDVDDRLGQLTYDNLFMPRIVKDVTQGFFQAVGWNIGTFNTIIGGLSDVRRLFNPEKYVAPLDKAGTLPIANASRLTNRLSYLIAMNVGIGTIGAITQYLMTGKLPDQIKDYYFPRTGRLNPDGSEERISFPGYMKDEYQVATHPIKMVENKMNPLLSSLFDAFITNKDFYDNQIRDKDASVPEQAAELTNWVFHQFQPYSFQGAQQRGFKFGDPSTYGSSILPFFGVMPAPSSVTGTAFTDYLAENARDKRPEGGFTRDQQEKAKNVRDAMDAIKHGKTPDLSNLTHTERREVEKSKHLLAPTKRFQSLSLEQKIVAYQKATPEERLKYKLHATIMHGHERALENISPADRPEVKAKLRDISEESRQAASDALQSASQQADAANP